MFSANVKTTRRFCDLTEEATHCHFHSVSSMEGRCQDLLRFKGPTKTGACSLEQHTQSRASTCSH